jgi:hypothetical protein
VTPDILMADIPMSQLFSGLFSFAYEGLNLEKILSNPTTDEVSTLLDEVSPSSIPPIFYAHSRD